MTDHKEADCKQEDRIKGIERRLGSYGDPKFLVMIFLIIVSGVSAYFMTSGKVTAQAKDIAKLETVTAGVPEMQNDIRWIRRAVERLEKNP